MNPTIYDVAKNAGVSIATVSRVLNKPQKVNEETRAAVLQAIDELGYTPKLEARTRALKESGRIGVITPFFTAPSFVQRLRGIASVLTPSDYELVIYTVDSFSRLQSYLETLPINGNLDGLIIVSLRFEDALASRLVERKLQTVLIEYPQKLLSSVEIDDIAGGKMVAEYLLKKGHRTFGFLGDSDIPEYGIHPISHRLVGFRQGLNQAGIELPEEQVYLVPYDMETTRQHTFRLLDSKTPPTAIFAATDLQAMGVLRAAHDRGLRLPEDLAVVGFDDLDMAEYVGLTTVRQHLDISGKLAVEILFTLLAEPSRPIQHVHLPLEIIERETA